jgi:hypothetical protein
MIRHVGRRILETYFESFPIKRQETDRRRDSICLEKDLWPNICYGIQEEKEDFNLF